MRGDGGAADVIPSQQSETRGEEEVVIAGLTYKPNTKDLRSPLVEEIVTGLAERGMDVSCFDSEAENEMIADYVDAPILQSLSLTEKDALVIPTPHDEILQLNLREAVEEMAENPVLIDVMGGFDKEVALEAGFDYWKL